MPQYLSTDPHAGAADAPKYLSTDPAAGAGPSQLTESKAHAQLRGFKEGAKEGASDLYEGTKEGLSGVYQMIRHPVDTAKAMGGGFAAAADAVPDIARNLANPDARGATIKGFAKGGAEGAAGVDGKASFSRQVGQFIGGTVIPSVATAGTVKGIKLLRAAPAATFAVETAGEAGSGPRVAQVRSSGQPIKLKAVGGTPVASEARVPSVAPQAAVEAAAAAEPAFQAQAARKAPRIAKVAGKAVTPAELPESWKPFVDVDSPAAAKAEPRPKMSAPEVAQTLRETYGAKEAAARLGVDESAIRRMAPGPSRKPMKARMADLDSDYTRLINDERGAIDPAVLRTLGLAVGGGVVGSLAADDHPLAGGLAGALGGAALANPVKTLKGLQQARMIGMLSGAAPIKSAAGNIGAILTAAAEQGSAAPIREALRLPTNLKNAAAGFANGAHPGGGVVGKLNIFGRTMSGLDDATRQALLRAGLSEEEAHRLLLTKPNPLGHGTLAKAAASPVGQAALPFQKIPFNTVAEGINSLNELAPGSGASNVRKALTVGAGAAGAAAGNETDNPLILGLLAALAGPRAIPFGLGAAVTGGPKVLERIGTGLPDASWKDVLDPLRPINKPALLRLLQQMQGG